MRGVVLIRTVASLYSGFWLGVVKTFRQWKIFWQFPVAFFLLSGSTGLIASLQTIGWISFCSYFGLVMECYVLEQSGCNVGWQSEGHSCESGAVASCFISGEGCTKGMLGCICADWNLLAVVHLTRASSRLGKISVDKAKKLAVTRGHCYAILKLVAMSFN